MEGSLAQINPVFSVWDGGSRRIYLRLCSHGLEQASRWPSAKCKSEAVQLGPNCLVINIITPIKSRDKWWTDRVKYIENFSREGDHLWSMRRWEHNIKTDNKQIVYENVNWICLRTSWLLWIWGRRFGFHKRWVISWPNDWLPESQVGFTPWS